MKITVERQVKYGNTEKMTLDYSYDDMTLEDWMEVFRTILYFMTFTEELIDKHFPSLKYGGGE